MKQQHEWTLVKGAGFNSPYVEGTRGEMMANPAVNASIVDHLDHDFACQSAQGCTQL